MKRLIRSIKPLTFLFVLLLIGGCIRSIHPIYTSSDVIFRDELIGTWRQSGQQATWQFTRSKDDELDQAYRLVYTDKKGRPGTFLAHLVQLKDELFLDLYPVAPNVANNGFYKFHFQRIHTFLHVELDDSQVKLAAMNPKWLEEHFKKNPAALAHTTVTPSGHLPADAPESSAERVLLTASTADLQHFFLKHRNTKGAYGDAIELKQVHYGEPPCPVTDMFWG